MLWALLDVLRREGLQVQSFLWRADFVSYRDTTAVTGLSPRHLDSWLMSPELCRQMLLRGSQNADIAVVQGKFATALDNVESAGGRLETLCDWLDLPRLAILDVSRIGACQLPHTPERVDGLFLDRVLDRDHAARLSTDLEALWGIPVLGALPLLLQSRAALEAIAQGDAPPRELHRELGRQLIQHRKPGCIRDLATRRDFTHAAVPPVTASSRQITLAMAYDDAFHCYFPDVLELLELQGAKVVDFSPLRDEVLPRQSDVVYLGCGRPERYAAELAENHCMKFALRSHLRQGRRIYCEGGGMAYLCQRMETLQGEFKRMVGIIPAEARLCAAPQPPQPVEATLSRASWLGAAGSKVRGYRNPTWHLEPAGPLLSFLAEEGCRRDMVGSFHAVASRLHLNFAALPGLLHHFFRPHHYCPAVPDPWTAVQ
ncbi:MAG: hypothetical protein ABIK89_24520 [Planctomycetota bacterium]